MPKTSRLGRILDQLERMHGPPDPPPSSDPFALVLWENVAYLATDEKRRRAFEELEREIGLRPKDVLDAPEEKLYAVASAGIKPDIKVEAMREAARVALTNVASDLTRLQSLTPRRALRVLKTFPAIGGPGAEKILLFSRTAPLFALESNGLRVLVRLGYGKEQKSYSSTYRSVREAVESQTRRDVDWLIRAHQLLRRHGQETCRRSAPKCKSCPLQEDCAYFARG